MLIHLFAFRGCTCLKCTKEFILFYCCPVKLIMRSKTGWKPNNHIAQGNALGKYYTPHLHSPCKGNSLIIKLLPLQGALLNMYIQYPGRCPGLCSAAPSGRATREFWHPLFCFLSSITNKEYLQTMPYSAIFSVTLQVVNRLIDW